MIMDSLKQYTDLFKDNRKLLEDNSSEFLNRFRDAAFDMLEKSQLPSKGSENYETTDLNDLLAPDFGVNLARVNINVNPSNVFKCGVPQVSTSLFMMLNDIYQESPDAEKNLQKGVFIGNLNKFGKQYPEIAARYYGSIADITNPLTALNTLLAQDGIVVYVAKDVKMEKPVQIINLFDSGVPLMAIRRLLVILEDGAKAQILSCDHTQRENMKFLSLQTTEIFVGKGASLDFYELEESTRDTTRLSTIYMALEKDCEATADAITLYNGNTRNEYYASFNGEGASLNLCGMGILDETRHLDTFSRVIHNIPRCHTSELFKYVLDDKAVGAFTGLVKVAQGADHTEAYQSNRNIISSDDAYMYSKPQLEIYDDDVKCSHGCATGQIDEQQVFYMQTRGIPRNTALFLLKQAFMADVIDAISLPGLRERLHLLVEKRFSGEPLGCFSCSAGCITENSNQ